jgi:monofunctional glycosyltransferase
MMLVKALWTHLRRLVALLLVATLALQIYFVARIALMRAVDPQSTTFQRSEATRLLSRHGKILWSQQWTDYERISEHLKRAVIASEDAGFTEHHGVEWSALEQAFDRNQRTRGKLVGGSTITQQLAKNLFLAGERTVLRKAQELLIALMLEALLNKRRILEIYLNNVEWGEGIFGAHAAARHYFHVDAAQLTPQQAAQLAVMLPAPKRFEKRPNSAYVLGRAATVMVRMPEVSLP